MLPSREEEAPATSHAFANVVPPTAQRPHHQPEVSVHEVVDDGYYDVDFSWVPTNALRKTAKFVYPVCNRTVQIMESIGGVIVNTFGLNQSRFQYAVDEYYRRERAKLEKEQLAYRREREKILARARLGLDEDDEPEEDGDRLAMRGTYCPPLTSEKIPLSLSL